MKKPIEILLVEDNAGDADLFRECLTEFGVPSRLSVIEDGEQALAFVRRQGSYADAMRPDLIVLDLNLPRKGGREVLDALKTDDALKRIPVVILTTSKAREDVEACYDRHANCYITKPRLFEQYADVMRTIEEFWLSTATLPPHPGE